MPLQSYGVLVGRAVATRREGGADTPHYQVHVVDDAGSDYRLAVNVMSQQSPSELLYLVDDDFSHPLLERLAGDGWTALAPGTIGGGLDFVRGNLFDRAAMRLLPPDVSGPDNDLADLLDHWVGRAMADPGARVYAFGERWPTEPTTPDKVFGFLPGNGVHDIHMNQGNSGRFAADDGVWQDGGLLVRLPAQDRWVAIFLAFQSQAWHTDDLTGHTLGDEGGEPAGADARVRIVGALVNPAGPAPESESATVMNCSAAAVDLTGWRLADRSKHQCPLPAVILPPGESLRVAVTMPAQLGNGGGTITLLDAQGLKVDGVAYTRDDARREGWTVVF